MGVFTDYTRLQRAKNFVREYQNRIYFCFGYGDPRWDSTVDPSEHKSIPLANYSLDDFVHNTQYTSDLCIYASDGSWIPRTGQTYCLDSMFGDCPPFPVMPSDLDPFTELPASFFFESRRFTSDAELNTPIGILALSKASLHYVEDVTDESDVGDRYTFSYGGRIWAYVGEDELYDPESNPEGKKCRSVLVEAVIRSCQLDGDIQNDRKLIIRQVSALVFDPSSAVTLDSFRDFMVPCTPDSGSHPLPSDYTSSIYRRFDFTKTGDQTSGAVIGMKDVHVMINDYLVSSPRQENQQDRYAYVIGF